MKPRHTAQAAHDSSDDAPPKLVDLPDDADSGAVLSTRGVSTRALPCADEELEDDAESILRDAVFSTLPPKRLQGKLSQPALRAVSAKRVQSSVPLSSDPSSGKGPSLTTVANASAISLGTADARRDENKAEGGARLSSHALTLATVLSSGASTSASIPLGAPAPKPDGENKETGITGTATQLEEGKPVPSLSSPASTVAVGAANVRADSGVELPTTVAPATATPTDALSRTILPRAPAPKPDGENNETGITGTETKIEEGKAVLPLSGAASAVAVGAANVHADSGVGLSATVALATDAPSRSIVSGPSAPDAGDEKRGGGPEQKTALFFRITRITPAITHSPEDELDFKSWEDYARGHIGAALDAKDFDRFKFLMGPAFLPIQSRLKNERDFEIDTRNFHAFCKSIFYERALEGINIFGTYIKNKALLLDCEQEVARRIETPKKATDKSRAFLEEIKSSHEVFLAKSKEIQLEKYKKEWADVHLSRIDELRIGSMLSTGPIALLQDENIALTPEIKKQLKQSLLKWMSPWIEDEIYRTFSIVGASKEQVKSYLRMLQGRLIDQLLEKPSLGLLKQKLRDASLVEKRKDEKAQQRYQMLIETEKTSFRAFATRFLEIPGNRTELIEFVAPTIRTTKGKSVPELIEMIIKYKLFYDRLFSDQGWLARIFAGLEKINDNLVLHKQFEEILEKNCLMPHFNKSEATLINQHIKKTHPDNKNASKEEIECRKMSLKHAYQDTLVTYITTPLNECQLRLMLDYFSCTTQAQILFKNIIKKYLASEFEEWLPWMRSFSSKHEKRYRQIQYLISSLYRAKEAGYDVGILFNDPAQKDEILVGINLVLEVINQEKPRSSWLQEKLQLCLTLIHKRHAQQTELQLMPADGGSADLLMEFKADQDPALVGFSIFRPPTHFSGKALLPGERQAIYTWSRM